MTGKSSPRRPPIFSGLLGLLLALVACTPSSSPPTSSSSPPTSSSSPRVETTVIGTVPDTSEGRSDEIDDVGLGDLVRGTVQVLQVSGGGTIGWGSGTIVSHDGLILTNAHVASPGAPGLAAVGRDPEGLVVGLVLEEDQPPVPTYFAEVLTAEGYLDLAVLQITATIDGDPIAPADLDLSYVELGDSDQIVLGDGLTVLGFPGVGGDTISLTTGQVAGFLADDRVGSRAWVKTDTVIAQGNSGGLAANRAGLLVGIPTEVAVGADFGELGRLRPVNLAKPLIDDARAGERYVRDSTVVAGGGREQVTLRTWTTDVDGEGCPIDSVEDYPSGATSVVAVFDWTGMTDGQEASVEWVLDSREVLYSDSFVWAGGPAGACAWFALHNGGAPLPEGTYDLVLSSQIAPIGQASTRVGGGPRLEGVTVGGRIADLDTGVGIPGALIYILQPGVDVESWISSDRNFAQVLTSAQTDPQGRYLLPGALEPGVEYPALVEADGYQPVWGDIVIGAGAPETIELEDIWLVRR